MFSYEAILCTSIATLSCWVLAPKVVHFLQTHNIYDTPNHRSVHRRQILRMGGLIILTGFIAGAICAPLMVKLNGSSFDWELFAGNLLCGLLIAATGAADDILNLSPKAKLVVQIAISGIAVSFGLKIPEIHFFDHSIELGTLAIPFTMFWLVGITNAVNLIDGMDGLAGGITLLSFFNILLLSQENPSLSLLCGIVSGILVFLSYNRYPAKIFMGDVGSLFLGFQLAFFSVSSINWTESSSGFFLPVLLCGLPILDTSWAIFRRLASGKHPFHADRRHIHHRLLNRGLRHYQVVGLLYLFSFFLNCICHVTLMTSPFSLSVFLIFSLIFLATFGRMGKCMEEATRRLSLNVQHWRQ